MAKKKAKVMLSSFSIILILIFGLGILSHVLPNAQFVGEEIVNGSGTVGATLSQVLMAPIQGFENAIDVGIFIMMLGGLLAVINKTGALETGIKVLVHKLKGREILLIPILMLIFSICGTTYGMLEETVGFYVLLAATMMAAGMDPLVGSAVVLLGAGSGCLGSTINPFATGVAISALPEGIACNQGLVILIAVFLFVFNIFKPNKYFKKVKDKYPMIYKGFCASAVGCVTTLLVNDSGVVAAATASIYILIPIIVGLINITIFEEDDNESNSNLELKNPFKV